MILLGFIITSSITLLFLIASQMRKNSTDEHSRNILKHLSILEIAMGALSMMLGLFLLFDWIEKNTIADFYSFKPDLIMITASFLFGVLNLSMFGVLVIKLARKAS